MPDRPPGSILDTPTRLIAFLLLAPAALGGCGHAARPTGADATAVCDRAAAWWRAALAPSDSGQVTVTDTALAPPPEARPRAVCLVRVELPHGARPGAPTAAGSGDGVPPALRGSGDDWRRLDGYDADGPDGSISGYRRQAVVCTVAGSWDGGDDSDSTVVADDWYREELTCWTAPTSQAVAGPPVRSAP